MSKEMIRRAVRTSLFLGMLFVVFLGIAFFLRVAVNAPLVIVNTFSAISAVLLFLAVFLAMFGFFLPVLGGYAYHNIMSEKERRTISRFWIWRFLLDLENEGCVSQNEDSAPTSEKGTK
jgi:predicted membrane protein